MLIWVVTGGIATGKSTFCQLVDQWAGAEIFDCDACVHDLLTTAEVTAIISASFPGEHLLAENGELDRERLRDLVFSDQAKRKILEGILHPRVRERFKETRERVSSDGKTKLLLADIPLFYETQFNIDHSLEIVVATSPAVQKQRLMERSGLPEDLADRIISAQLPILAKVAMADCVIWNDGSLSSLEDQVTTLRARFFSS